MYSFESRVRYSECDENAVMTYSALINYLQDCCTFQSEDLGIGFSYLREQQLGWFITSWDIKIKRMPRLGDKITISTWPYGFRGFFGSRNFSIVDESGECIVEADSLWILMDLAKGAPKRLPEIMQERFVLDEPLASNVKRGRMHCDQEAEKVRSFVVDQTYVDSNHHMNNGYYVEAAVGEVPAGSGVTTILVEYKKSAVLGDEIQVLKKELDQGWQISMTSTEGEVFAIVEFRGE